MKPLHPPLAAIVAVVVAAVSVDMTAQADNKIYTGGRSGSYFNSFGPKIDSVLERSFFHYDVATSAGSGENLRRVIEDPSAIGLAQSDVLAFETSQDPSWAEQIVIIRSDVAYECVFAITSPDFADRLRNWGDVQSFARRLTIAVGPEASGSATTLRFLRRLSDRLAQARVMHMENTDTAIATIIDRQAQLGFFVQFADTGNPRFETINDAELSFIPVIDRSMLRQRVNGEPVYKAQEVKVTSAGLLSWRGVKRVVTACTPLVIITGSPDRFPEGSAERLDLVDMIAALRDAPVEELRPDEGWFTALLDDAVELSGQGLETLLEQAERAAQELQQ